MELPNVDLTDAAKALARGETPLGAEGVPEEIRVMMRTFGERILDLEKKESRAQSSLVDLRMMLEGYTRVKRELRQENEQLRQAADPGRQPIIGADGGLAAIMRLVEKIVDTPISVLITGETGTGKEVLARTIHGRSARALGPFLAINCAALPESLLESELFGIEKSVATGVAARPGKLVEASGGTLFLDEVGDMPLNMQAKILRALQEQEVVHVGGSRAVKFDARVISATNKDIRAKIAAQEFREDLYYRLVGVEVHLPPLRERPGDVDRLVEHFVGETARRFNRAVRGVTEDARRALHVYRWPGNVRELIAEIQRAVAVADGAEVGLADLTPRVAAAAGPQAAPAGAGAEPESFEPLREARRRFERAYVRRVLERTSGSKKEAARILGLTPEGFRRKMLTLEDPAGGDEED
jgi:transcriptional regulator with PAS, ATPase and Fis domain